MVMKVYGTHRRVASKTEKALFDSVDEFIKNKVPSCRKKGKKYDYVMITISKDLYDCLKLHPKFFTRGRWLYFKYRIKVIFVRYIKIEKPQGCHEVKISVNRNFNPETLKDYSPSTKALETLSDMEAKPFGVNWEIMELPWEDDDE